MSEPRSDGSSPGGEGGKVTDGDEEARLRRERMRAEQRKQREKVSPEIIIYRQSNFTAFVIF